MTPRRVAVSFAVARLMTTAMIDPEMAREIVAALGDSITAGSPGWDPDPAVRSGIDAPSPESSWEHWAALARPDIELRNYGVYGERTDEIARRLDACAAGADVLVVQGGINDVAQGRAVEAAAADLRRDGAARARARASRAALRRSAVERGLSALRPRGPCAECARRGRRGRGGRGARAVPRHARGS